MESQDPTLLDPALVPEDFDEEEEEYHAALALEYFTDTYEKFLHDGMATFPEQDKQLEARYSEYPLYRGSSSNELTDDVFRKEE